MKTRTNEGRTQVKKQKSVQTDEPETIIDVTVNDGKYRVVLKKGGNLHALRHGEPWPGRNLIGDNLVLHLAFELQDARERIKELEWEIDVLKSPNDTEYFS